ncbi:MAG: PQQ-dependent sugar dehydrogenase [Sphingomonas sp.]|nr:PQQ-dependent sugar dehydrogenase [Sphingomonas sp.]
MRAYLFQSLALVALAACGASPPATAEANSAGQRTEQGRPFTVTELSTFQAPWAMDFLPASGRLANMALVTEKAGRLWLVDVASGSRQQVTGVPAVKAVGQGGLGDVVAHPGFAGNQRVYLSYVERGAGGISGAVLGYGRLMLGQGQPRIDGFKVIWRQTPKVTGNGHYAHRIAFAPDGTLYLSSGEREKKQPAQDRNVDLGKIIHMTAEGQRIGGPFATMGHRNVLGLDFAPDGRLWAAEMGPQGGDEFNLIVPGRNYGWPEVSYGSHYGGEAIPDDHKARGFEEPKLWWNPAISPGALLIYSGNLFPQWKGDALIAALSGQALVRVDIEGDRARKANQWDMGTRIRAVDQGPDGAVYLLEDGDGGRLLRLDPVRE